MPGADEIERGRKKGACVMVLARCRHLVALFVFLMAPALPAGADLPWQPERWTWVHNPISIDTKTTTTPLLLVSSPRELQHATGVQLLSLRLELDAETQPEHVVFSWQVTVANPSPRDYFAVAAVYFRTPDQQPIALPLLAPLRADRAAFGPSWEHHLRPGDPVPIQGTLKVDRRAWQTFLREGNGRAEVATASRLPSAKLEELQRAVPMATTSLQDRIATGEQAAEHLRREVTTLRDQVKDLQAERDEVSKIPIPEQPGALTFIFYGDEKPPKTAVDRVKQTIESFENLYDPLGANIILATLPDPIDSPFAREFDLLLAAIREAAEHCGYVFDRRYLPWKPGADDPIHRREPGILLFRAPTDQVAQGLKSPSETPPCARPFDIPGSKDLAVLIVGERPDTGVQTGALRQALDRWHQAREEAHERANEKGERWPFRPATLRILGPTFSGTRDSLKQGLISWREKHLQHQANTTPEAQPPAVPHIVQFDLVSGSATASSNAETFEGKVFAEPPAGGDTRPARCGHHDGLTCFRYRSMALTDRTSRTALNDYLIETLQIPPHRIALLIESSLYGDEFTREETSKTDGHTPPTQGRTGEQSSQDAPLLMRFPMHIAQLRADLAARDEREQPEDEVLTRDPFVAIDSRGSGRHARWQPLAPGLTSPTANVMLAAVLKHLVDERIEAVGILATDVQDKLFLAQQIRRHAPNVRLFTFEGDLLLAHPHVAEYTRGMIVASSHSLEISSTPSPNEHAATSLLRSEKARNLHYRFANDWSHGAFLAMATLLTHERAAQEWITKQRHGGVQARHEPRISLVGRGELLLTRAQNQSPVDQPTRPVLERLGRWLHDRWPFDSAAYADDGNQPAGSPDSTSLAAAASNPSASNTGIEEPPPNTSTGPERVARAVPHSWSLVLAIAFLTGILMTFMMRWSRAPTQVSFGWRDLYSFTNRMRDKVGPATVQDGRLLLAVLHTAMAIILLLLTVPYAPFEEKSRPFSEGYINSALIPVLPLLLTLALIVSSAWLCSAYAWRLSSAWAGYAYARARRGVRRSQLRKLRALRQQVPDTHPAAHAGEATSRVRRQVERRDALRERLERIQQQPKPPRLVRPTMPFRIAHLLPPFLWGTLLLLLHAMLSDNGLASWMTERAYALGHAVSPLLPSLLLTLCPLVWVASGLRRCPQLQWLRVGQPEHRATATRHRESLPDFMVDLYEAFNPLAKMDGYKATALVAFVATPCFYIWLYYRQPEWRILRSLESKNFDVAISVLLLVSLIVAVSGAVRLFLGARALGRILDVGNQWRTAWEIKAEPWQKIGEKGQNAFRLRRAYRDRSAAREQAAEASNDVAAHTDQAPRLAWFQRAMTFEREDADIHAELNASAAGSGHGETQVGDAFFCDFAVYILTASRQLRSLLYITMAIFLLVFLAVATYPFQPQRLLMLYTGWLLAAASIIGTIKLTQVESHTLMRWAEGHTKQNLIFEPGFLQNVMASAVLPAISILATQFPALRNLLFDWVRPLLRMLG